MPPENLERVGRYEPIEVLRQDLFARVFRAKDEAGRRVVLRLYSRNVVEGAGLEGSLGRQLAIAKSLDHPNIVRVLDHGEHLGQTYVVMEEVDGEPLERHLLRRTFELPEVLALIKQVARALRHAHRAGMMHGRLTPSSILVSPDFQHLWIADFGTAVLASEQAADLAATTGVLNLSRIDYLPPERERDLGSLDHRGDIYSLGALFYELLTARPPSRNVQLPSQVKADLPPQLDPIILGCLALNPNERTPSIDRFLSALGALQETERLALVEEVKGFSRGTKKLLGKGGRTDASASKMPWILGGLLLAVLAAAVTFFVLAGRQQDTDATTADPPRGSAESTATTTAEVADAGLASEAGDPLDGDDADPEPETEPVAEGTAASGAPDEPRPSPPTPSPRQREPAAAPAAAAAPDETPATEAAEEASSLTADLEVARGKLRSKLYDEAASDLSRLIGEHPSDPATPSAYLLLAEVYRAQDLEEKAQTTYVEVANRFASTPEAAEALLAHAKLLMEKRRRRAEARPLLTELVARHGTSPRAPEALRLRAELEAQLKIKAMDGELRTDVPAALVTYRQLTRDYKGHRESESALWELADLYEDEKRFELATEALVELATTFPATRHGAWFRAAELAEKRLKDPARAREYYSQVAEGSADYRNAQSKLKRLGS